MQKIFMHPLLITLFTFGMLSGADTIELPQLDYFIPAIKEGLSKGLSIGIKCGATTLLVTSCITENRSAITLAAFSGAISGTVAGIYSGMCERKRVKDLENYARGLALIHDKGNEILSDKQHQKALDLVKFLSNPHQKYITPENLANTGAIYNLHYALRIKLVSDISDLKFSVPYKVIKSEWEWFNNVDPINQDILIKHFDKLSHAVAEHTNNNATKIEDFRKKIGEQSTLYVALTTISNVCTTDTYQKMTLGYEIQRLHHSLKEAEKDPHNSYRHDNFLQALKDENPFHANSWMIPHHWVNSTNKHTWSYSHLEDQQELITLYDFIITPCNFPNFQPYIIPKSVIDDLLHHTPSLQTLDYMPPNSGALFGAKKDIDISTVESIENLLRLFDEDINRINAWKRLIEHSSENDTKKIASTLLKRDIRCFELPDYLYAITNKRDDLQSILTNKKEQAGKE